MFGVLALVSIILATNETVCLSGAVRYEGTVPRHSTADDLGKRRPLLAVDKDSGGLQYAVVYLESLDAEPDAHTKSPSQHVDFEVVVDQEEYRFVPNVIAIRAGQRVAFGNSDFANHNVRTDAEHPRNAMNIVTQPDRRFTKRFQREPDGGPVRLSCDIHAWMDGWIYVFDHPYFAVTDRKGQFAIDDVRPGTYRLHIAQPDGGLHAAREITVHAEEDVRAVVTFAPDHLDNQTRPTISVDD